MSQHHIDEIHYTLEENNRRTWQEFVRIFNTSGPYNDGYARLPLEVIEQLWISQTFASLGYKHIAIEQNNFPPEEYWGSPYPVNIRYYSDDLKVHLSFARQPKSYVEEDEPIDLEPTRERSKRRK